MAGPVFEILEKGGESAKLNRIIDSLRARGLSDFATVDVGIVRGLAYYTGVVFEVFDRAGKFRAIAGGGRYDQLIAQLSDNAVSLPALGFAIGDVVLGEMIHENPSALGELEASVRSDRTIEIYGVIAKEERRAVALAVIQQLRDQGYRLDYPMSPTKVPRQFQTAEQLGAQTAILFGDEWPNVAVKKLASGEQRLVPHEELVAHLVVHR